MGKWLVLGMAGMCEVIAVMRIAAGEAIIASICMVGGMLLLAMLFLRNPTEEE